MAAGARIAFDMVSATRRHALLHIGMAGPTSGFINIRYGPVGRGRESGDRFFVALLDVRRSDFTVRPELLATRTGAIHLHPALHPACHHPFKNGSHDHRPTAGVEPIDTSLELCSIFHRIIQPVKYRKRTPLLLPSPCTELPTQIGPPRLALASGPHESHDDGLTTTVT